MTRSKGIKVPVLFLFFDTKSASPFVTRRLINKFMRAQWQGQGVSFLQTLLVSFSLKNCEFNTSRVNIGLSVKTKTERVHIGLGFLLSEPWQKNKTIGIMNK